MPFENTYGNGGLLTTVGDLLVWNEHMLFPDSTMRAIVEEQQQPGHLDSGRPLSYGLGLFIGDYGGQREISHDGQTAGYTAFLAEYPDNHLSVAVLCNSDGADIKSYAHNIVDLFSAPAKRPWSSPLAKQRKLESDEFTYIDSRTHLPSRVRISSEDLQINDGFSYKKVSTSKKVSASIFKHSDTIATLQPDGATLTLWGARRERIEC
jgi:CubicO group peptidase (beta-lactamase class C family)